MSRRRQLLLLAVLPPAAVTLAALLMGVAGMAGVDTAAHAYRLQLLRQGSPIMWDTLWYSGTYGAANYGIVYYLLAQRLGMVPILIVSAGSLPLLFHLYIRKQWGVTSLAPPLVLAGVLVAYLANGQDPYLLSLALVIGGLVLFAYRRPAPAALLFAVAAFTNPVGPVCGAVFLAADVIARPAVRRPFLVMAAVLAPFAALRLALLLLFSEKAVYLNQASQHLKFAAVAALGFTLAWFSRDPDRRGRLAVFAVAGGLSLVAVLPALAGLGNNADRFLLVFAAPLLLCIRECRLPRLGPVPAVVVAAVVVAAVQLYTPLGYFAQPSTFAASRRPYFAPALQFARSVYDPDYRVHVVDLEKHAEAYYFPLAGFPITRGWLRQADAQHNELLYGPYDSRQYVAWLRELGVEYVFVPDGRLDFSSSREPAAIAASRELEKVWSGGHWTAYRVLDPSPLVVPSTPAGEPAPPPSPGLLGQRAPAGSSTQGAHVVSYGRAEIDLQVDRPGLYLVRTTWSRFWTTDNGTLHEAPGAWVLLHADRVGLTRLRYSATGLESTIDGAL